jgi:hypothetical protein
MTHHLILWAVCPGVVFVCEGVDGVCKRSVLLEIGFGLPCMADCEGGSERDEKRGACNKSAVQNQAMGRGETGEKIFPE